MPTPDGQYTEREWLEGLRYEDKFPDEGEVSGMDVIAREAFEQAVTDILFALSDWTELNDGPDVDAAREAVMRELLAYCDPKGAVSDRGVAIKALSKIAAGPNDNPAAEPWSKAEALIALNRLGGQ